MSNAPHATTPATPAAKKSFLLSPIFIICVLLIAGGVIAFREKIMTNFFLIVEPQRNPVFDPNAPPTEGPGAVNRGGAK